MSEGLLYVHGATCLNTIYILEQFLLWSGVEQFLLAMEWSLNSFSYGVELEQFLLAMEWSLNSFC